MAKRWPKCRIFSKRWDFIVLVLVSAHAKRVGVSRMRDSHFIKLKKYTRLFQILRTIFNNIHLFSVKENIKQHLFDKVKKLQLGHSNTSNIKYKTFKAQKYLTNHKLNNHEVSLLFSLRSRTAYGFKAKFPYNIEQLFPFGCEELDTQEHCILCEKAYPNSLRNPDIVYNDIFSDDSAKQSAVVKLFSNLLERREETSFLNTGPSCCPEGDSNSSHACIGNKYIYIVQCLYQKLQNILMNPHFWYYPRSMYPGKYGKKLHIKTFN